MASDDGFDTGLDGVWIGFIRAWIRSPPPLVSPERALVTRFLHRLKPNKILINSRAVPHAVRSLNPLAFGWVCFGCLLGLSARD